MNLLLDLAQTVQFNNLVPYLINVVRFTCDTANHVILCSFVYVVSLFCVYVCVRAPLHSTQIGEKRKTERDDMREFISLSLPEEKVTCLYTSGRSPNHISPH